MRVKQTIEYDQDFYEWAGLGYGKPYSDYSYLEDLICWCIGVYEVRREKHEECDRISLMAFNSRDKWKVGNKWNVNTNGIWSFGANSPTEALENLLLELIGVSN